VAQKPLVGGAVVAFSQSRPPLIRQSPVSINGGRRDPKAVTVGYRALVAATPLRAGACRTELPGTFRRCQPAGDCFVAHARPPTDGCLAGVSLARDSRLDVIEDGAGVHVVDDGAGEHAVEDGGGVGCLLVPGVTAGALEEIRALTRPANKSLRSSCSTPLSRLVNMTCLLVKKVGKKRLCLATYISRGPRALGKFQ